MSKLKLKNLLTEKKPWQGYKAHAVHGKAEVDFLNLISDFPDWKKYNKLTDKGKNVIFFTKKDKNALVWQTSNGREVQATNLKGDESSYKSYKVKDIYKVLIEGKLNEWNDKDSFKSLPKRWSGAYSNDDSGLTEFEQLGGRDEINEGPKIKKGDIKKGKFVWFEDGKNSAVRVKVKNIVPSKDGKEEHYVTNKGTFTPKDVVGF